MGMKSCSKFLRFLVTVVHFTDQNWISKTVYCCLKCVWPGSELLIWYAVSFQTMPFRNNQQWPIEVRASGIFLFSHWKCISTNAMPVTIKLCGVVTYHEWVPPSESLEPLIARSFDITWETQNIFHCQSLPMVTKLDSNSCEWALTHKVIWPFDLVVLWNHAEN